MILLDTNIISELMRPKPNSAVIEWLDEQFSHELFLPAIVKAEIDMGIAILDNGKRKQALFQVAELIFTSLTNRCLPTL
ncbi:PIN domain-containing protein [Methyloprofundus sedimenti]|uniref:PIN domain-containing protein n=1 Tax=Methyloprofundus sedimenti TaxID=1420851 RepID=UPI0018E9DE2F|nr:PIN domain-containing protein [Methyloprofundus sedimenti]